MKCNKCGNNMIQLFSSWVCDGCSSPKQEDVSAKEHEGPIIIPNGLKPQARTISTVGFYYDPEYAKLYYTDAYVFQIQNPHMSGPRLFFNTSHIRELLLYIKHPAYKGGINIINRVSFIFIKNSPLFTIKYDNKHWAFDYGHCTEIYKFFSNFVTP